ncbi:MAG: type 1 glutamine amidotransferase [Planctomycetota bacterium]|jgi:type 1 glutamine amidotransferase
MRHNRTLSTLRSLLTLVLLLAGNLVSPAFGFQSGQARISTLILTGQNRTDWRWTSTHFRDLLEASGRFDVEVSLSPEGTLLDTAYLARFDLLLIDYSGSRWGDAAEKNFLDAVNGGAGVVVIGDAVAAFENWTEYETLVGFKLGEYAYKSNFQSVSVGVTDSTHPVLKDFGGIAVREEQLATGLELALDDQHKVIATVTPIGTGAPAQPALVVGTYGKGRTFATPLGHVSEGRRQTWESQRSPESEKLFLRACEWAATGKVSSLKRMAHNTLSEADRAAGWSLLFDGNSPTGWKASEGVGLSEERWHVEGDALRVLPGKDSSNWFNAAEYREFELELEWKVEGGASSALGISRGQEQAGSSFAFDNSQGSDAQNILRPDGEFNHARVLATYDHVEHWLNGIKIMTVYTDPAQWARRMGEDQLARDPELSKLPLARIMLEGDGTAVWMRNVKIRPILEQAPAVSSSTTTNLFNGQNLDGWLWLSFNDNNNETSPFHVGEEGQLIGSGQPMGTERTLETYQNFDLSFKWRFNPRSRIAGKAAIMVRASGDDVRFPNAVEIRLDPNEVGTLWRQGKLELTGERRRTSGQLVRPIVNSENRVGEWNHMEVRLHGGDLLVLLNGQVVNNASDVTIQSGWIGLVTRGFEIQYSSLQLTPGE